MGNAKLMLNTGASSLKFAVDQADAAGTLQVEYRGNIGESGWHLR